MKEQTLNNAPTQIAQKLIAGLEPKNELTPNCTYKLTWRPSKNLAELVTVNEQNLYHKQHYALRTISNNERTLITQATQKKSKSIAV